MKYYLSSILTIWIVTTLAQDNVVLTQRFNIGETYRFEIIRGNEDSRNPSSKDAFSITSASATVENGIDGNRIVKFQYGETRMVGIEMPPDVLEQFKSQDVYYGIELSLIVDSEGIFYELENYSSAKDQLEKAMMKIYTGRSFDEATINKIKRQLATTYETEEKLIDTYFPELSIYFNAFGNTYTIGEVQQYEYETTNPFGGEPFPIQSKLELEEMDGMIAVIRGKETIRPDDLNRVLKSTFRKLAESNRQGFDEREIPEFTMESTTEMKYDTASNKLFYVSVVKNINASGVSQKITTRIKMID
ncbi:hypothetical protein [Ekhidna sp.]|uniref:hypothetical protein n=1 Tax=Ekhidna sp. TaxID=2608089 RepID=UPI003298C5C0